MPVTIDASAVLGYLSSPGAFGGTQWSAHVLHPYQHVVTNIDTSGTVSFGDNTDYKYCQSFVTPSGGMLLSEIRIAIEKIGAPTDNVTVKVHTNGNSADGAPDTLVATSQNTISGSNLQVGTSVWRSWHFDNVSLAGSTYYVFVVERSGSQDASNYYRCRTSWASPSNYPSGRLSLEKSGGWSLQSDNWDSSMQILEAVPSALYAFTQDSGGVHAWKSTNHGATWSEQDSANRPSVSNANYSFDTGPNSGTPRFMVVVHDAASGIALFLFDPRDDTWSTEYGTSAPNTVESTRSIRITDQTEFHTNDPADPVLVYISTLDDADIDYARIGGGTSSSGWSSAVVDSQSDFYASQVQEALAIPRGDGWAFTIYSAVQDEDLQINSIVGTTVSADVDIDTTVGDLDYGPTTFLKWFDATAGEYKVQVVWPDATDGDLQEAVVTLDSSSSPTIATQYEITTTGYANETFATARYNGTTYVVLTSGTSIVYYTSSSAGSWSGPTTLLSSLTFPIVGNLLALDDYGLALAYQDSGDVKIEWIDGPTWYGVRAASLAHLLTAGATYTRTASLAHRVAVLNTRTAALASLVKATLVRTATMNHRIAALSERSATMAHRVAVLVERSATLAHLVKATEERSATLAHRIAVLSERTAGLAHRVAVLSERTATLASRVAVTDTRTATMAHHLLATLQRTTTLAHLVTAPATREASLSHLLQATASRSAALASRIMVLNERTATLAHRIGVAYERTATLAHRIKVGNTRTAAISHRIQSLESRTASLSQRVAVLDTRSAALASRVQVGNTRTADLWTRLLFTASRSATLASRVAVLGARSGSLAHRIQAWGERSAGLAHQVSVAGTVERPAALSHRIETTPQRSATMAHLLVVTGERETSWLGEQLLVPPFREE